MLRSSRTLSQSHFRVSGSRLSAVWLVLTVKQLWLPKTSMVWRNRRICLEPSQIKESDCVCERSLDQLLRKLSHSRCCTQTSDRRNTARTGVDCQSTAHLSHQSLKSLRTCTHRHNRTTALSTAPGLSSDNDPTATSQTTQMYTHRLRCHGLRTPTITPEAQYLRVMHSTNKTHRIACT